MEENELRNRLDRSLRRDRYLCAQLVVSELAEAGGKDASEAVLLASGFCSGLGQTCGLCGAVSGAVMAIGLLAGESTQTGDYDTVYALVQEFRESFEESFGTINCFSLIECDLGTAEGQKKLHDENKREICLDAVSFAVTTALSILREQGYLEPDVPVAAGQSDPALLLEACPGHGEETVC